MGRRGIWVLRGGNNSFSLLLKGRERASPLSPPEVQPNPQTLFHKDLVFFFLFVLKITDTISKTQMPSVEGTAENTWVPPEGQHQGLHGPPTSPTLEQLGVWTAGSSLGLTPSSCPHLGRRWGRGLTPPINKCSPNPQGQGLRLSWDLERPLQQLVSNLVQEKERLLTGDVMGVFSGLGRAEECHPLFPKRPEAAPGSWAGDGGPTPLKQEKLGQFSYWLVQPHLSSESWGMREGSFSCTPGGGPKWSLAGAIFCGR